MLELANEKELFPSWVLPLLGSFKLNFNECALRQLRQRSIEGVVRTWIFSPMDLRLSNS